MDEKDVRVERCWKCGTDKQPIRKINGRKMCKKCWPENQKILRPIAK